MPTWGKRSSPQEMIGQRIERVEHKILEDGEHQVWFYAGNVNWVFFQPMGCCNKVVVLRFVVSLMDFCGEPIRYISFDYGEFRFTFDNQAVIELAWHSSKVGKNMTIDMIKLSKQELG